MKKYNLTIFILTMMISNLAFANTIQRQADIKVVTPNIVITMHAKYDFRRNLITPDKIMLAQAIKQYNDGFNGLSMVYFRKSAAFGNSNAQTQLGLMHIKALGVPKNWAIGYAWIRLAALDKTQQHTELKEQIYSLLSPEERAQSEVEYQEINKYFSRDLSYFRRVRWVHKVAWSVLGSRVGAQTSNIQSVNLNGTVNGIYGRTRKNAFEAFIDDFKFGIIESGEITPKEKGEEL